MLAWHNRQMQNSNIPQPAPQLDVAEWLNSNKHIELADLRGKVVLIEAFQMLCPGCVSGGLPMAQKARQIFKPADLVVLGLHTVFEHHAAQGTKEALSAFLHEYRINFPVGIDRHNGNEPLPNTMRAYQMRGTPTTILIDRQGRLRWQHFGQVEDMVIGAQIMGLLAEAQVPAAAMASDGSKPVTGECDDGACPVG